MGLTKKILVIFIFIIPLSSSSYVFAGYPKIAVVVHAPLQVPFSRIYSGLIIKAKELNAKGIRVKVIWKDMLRPSRDTAIFLKDMKRAIEDRHKILVSAFYGYAPEDYISILELYNRYYHNLFIIPWSDEKFEKFYGATKPNNVFILAEPIENILLLLEQFIKRYGYDFNLLRNELRKRQVIVGSKYAQWQKEISKLVGDAISDWEKSTGGEVDCAAYSYLMESYSLETIRYVRALPDLRADARWIKEITPKEINDILNAYYKKTGKKKVSVKILKTSGVNGCESLPCKQRCCDKYRKWNHECLHRVDCDKK